MSQVNGTWFNISFVSDFITNNASENPLKDLGLGSTQDPNSASPSSDFWQDAKEIAHKIFSPIIMICGTTGNILILLVLRRMRSDNSTLRLFFKALAVSDLALLFVGLLPVWVHVQFDYSILNSVQVCCKLIYWLFYSLGWLSPWLLSAMTIQRAVSVVWPHKVRSSCTKRQAYITITVLGLTIFLTTSHLLYFMDIHREFGVCFFLDSYIAKFLNVWLWMDLLTASLLPFFVLLLSNTVLIWKVLQSVRTAKQSLAGDQGADQVASREKKLSSMTVTLVTVSVAFILLTGPIACLSLHTFYLGHASADFETKFPYMKLVATVCNLLWYINSSINFFLYILTGTRFRQEFKALVGLRMSPGNSSTVKRAVITSGGKPETNSKTVSRSTQSSRVREDI